MFILDTPSGDTRLIEEDIPVVPVCVVDNAAQGRIDRTRESASSPVTLSDFREAQDNDEDCRQHRRNLLAGTAGPFSKDSDCLIYRRAPVYGREQSFVPESLRAAVMQRERNNPTAGHPGESRMFAAMWRLFYWPAMAVDTADHVRGCHPCARNRLSLHRRATPMELFPPDGPNEQVAIDLLGPLPRTEVGNNVRHRLQPCSPQRTDDGVSRPRKPIWLRGGGMLTVKVTVEGVRKRME